MSEFVQTQTSLQSGHAGRPGYTGHQAQRLLLDPVQRELDVIFQSARMPDKWLAASPGMHIGTRGVPGVRTRDLPDEEIRTAIEDLHGDGYLQLPSFLYLEEAARLRRALQGLHQMGFPPVFAFIYDEFWHATARLSSMLSAVLGTGYRQLPDFWAWHVNPSDDDRGWLPHRDRPGTLRPDGLPGTLTAWIALSEATPLNGCMYIVPAGRDERYGSSESQDIRRADLQNIRALPAEAGAVLMWNQLVYHWGARSSSRAAGPRISFACEFQRGDIKAYNAPLLDPENPPEFDLRLRLIGKQILQYQHMYRLPSVLSRLAEMLVSM